MATSCKLIAIAIEQNSTLSNFKFPVALILPDTVINIIRYCYIDDYSQIEDPIVALNVINILPIIFEGNSQYHARLDLHCKQIIKTYTEKEVKKCNVITLYKKAIELGDIYFKQQVITSIIRNFDDPTIAAEASQIPNLQDRIDILTSVSKELANTRVCGTTTSREGANNNIKLIKFE